MPKNRQPLTGKQELFIRMSAQGRSRADILQKVFGIDIETADARKINNADVTMCRWRKLPEFESVWKDEVKTILHGCTAEAIQIIRGQLTDGSIPWLQNKAANDLLNYGKSQIYGDDERTVHVQIDGLPDIGSPDDDA